MKKILSCCLLIFLVITACNKKEYPKDSIESSDAFFFSRLVINGTPHILEAGKNGYYMYSSYQQDTNNVYGFTGELKLTNSATNSPGSLKIQINDSKVSLPGDPSNINNSLVVGNYKFYTSGYSTLYGIEFESVFNRIPKNYKWNFGDGTSSSEVNPIHYYKNGGTFNACLTIEGSNTCNGSVCNPLTIDDNAFNAYINATNLSSNKFSFAVNKLGGKAPFTYSWNFGDLNSDSSIHSENPSHRYTMQGSYPVTVKITDADAKVNYLSYNLVTDGDQSSCASNFKIKAVLQAIQNIGLSEVIVSYTDANGVTYASSLNPQDPSSNFKIIAVEDFENNEKGEKTKKIRFSFNCILYSGSQSMTIGTTESSFCIAYK